MVTVESVKVIINGDDNVSEVFDKVDKKSKSVFGNIGSLAKTGALAFTAFGAAAAVGIGKAIDLASDFEETASKFGVVFDDVSEKSEQVAKDLQKNFGLSGKAAKKLLGDTGDLLTGFGFAGDEALGMSEQVNKLAVDLASFTNATGGAEAVSQALTKALLGERESLKTYGIAILEADVNARVLKNGMGELTGEALRQAKAQATLELAMEQSKNAIGDFERTESSFANQTRIAKARIEDLGVELGQVFLPIATKGITKIADFVTNLKGFTQEGTAAAEIFTAWKENAEVAFTFIGENLTNIFNFVRGAFEENKDFIIDTFDGLSSTFKSTFDLIGGIIGFFKDLWDRNFLGIADSIKTNVALIKFLTTIIIESVGTITDTLSFLFNNWEFIWESIKLTTFNAINGMTGQIENFFNSIINGVNKILPEFKQIENIDLGKFKIDTELTEAKVSGLKPTQTLTQITEERRVRLESAGTRLLEDLKEIESDKKQREVDKAARDEEFLKAFRESKQEVNITGDTIMNNQLTDQASIDKLMLALDDRDRRRLIEGGVTLS